MLVCHWTMTRDNLKKKIVPCLAFQKQTTCIVLVQSKEQNQNTDIFTFCMLIHVLLLK